MPDVRADHVGSLLRPESLLAARAAFAEGRTGLEELRSAEDSAILEALDMQRQCGVEVYSDGEYRRRSFLSELAVAVDGFVEGHSDMLWHGDDTQANKQSTSKVVDAKLRKRQRLTAIEVAFLAQHAPGAFKATVPDLSYFPISSWQRGVSDGAYPDRTDMLDDLAQIIRSEIEALLAEGVTYIQLDSVGFTTLLDDEQRDRLAATGTDPDEFIAACLRAEETCLRGLRREGVALAMHMCRGNSRNRWLASGGYDRIAPEVFSRVPVDRWLLEYDTERAGGFQPLAHVPSDATVVLGLVSTKTPVLEDPDDLMRRVEEASRYVAADNLALSPQCGFASVAEGNALTWDDQRRKLELVVTTAQRIWG
ncbi:MAG: cobalamin-independent methionine synthase II family protein [Streptosporangiales bacterium]